MMCLSKVIILYEFLRVAFQKVCVFSLGEPRGTEGNTTRLERVLFICVSEPYYAKAYLGKNKQRQGGKIQG